MVFIKHLLYSQLDYRINGFGTILFPLNLIPASPMLIFPDIYLGSLISFKLKKIKRPQWDRYFADIVEKIALRSTCFRRQVGALIVNSEREIVASGYNGNVRGYGHCEDIGCIKEEMGFKSGEGNDWCTAVHAEQNALLQAGKGSKGSTIYVNAFPCKICARLIVNAGIKKVVVSGEYTDLDGLKILEHSGIEVVNIIE